jgi:hypothetical protein
MSPGPPRGTGAYVYCIGHAEQLGHDGAPFASLGIGERGAEVRLIESGELAAVVSDSPVVRYDVTRANLQAHQRVLEEAMRRSDVLPVAFGTVAASDRDVLELLLDREREALRENLDYVRGRVELGLKVLWDRDRLFAEVVAENPEIRGLRDHLAGREPDAAYFERIRLGELTEAAIEQKRDQESEAILEALLPVAVDARMNQILTETMVLNAALLVEKDRVTELDDRVQRLGAAEADRLRFQYVGPLPPYNFVNLSVSWEV